VPTLITRGRKSGRVAASLALVLAMCVGLIAGAPSAGAQTNPFQRGPAPTAAALQAAGPFAISSTTVGSGNGFASATIYFPTDTSQGTFGGVAVAPGFTETQSALSWWAQRLASHGFVVISINTNSRFDQPSARATQLQNALNYLVNTSSARTRVDGSRLAVSGHSMGGGGTLEAARNNTALQAAIPLMPWDQTKSFPGIVTPTMIIAAQNDSVAPVNNHAIPFYNSITNAEKAYLELAGAGHNVSNSPNTTISRLGVAWAKRYIDNDTRYDQFLCPPPPTGNGISQYRNTCPNS
jgi:dienelactone hydrolase